jgi:hypothetical protein
MEFPCYYILPMLHTFPPYLNKLVRTIPQLSPTFLPIITGVSGYRYLLNALLKYIYDIME